MRRCIIIDIERMQDNKVEKVYQKLKIKYGNAVALYNEYDEKKLITQALGMFELSTWTEICTHIVKKYISYSNEV